MAVSNSLTPSATPRISLFMGTECNDQNIHSTFLFSLAWTIVMLISGRLKDSRGRHNSLSLQWHHHNCRHLSRDQYNRQSCGKQLWRGIDLVLCFVCQAGFHCHSPLEQPLKRSWCFSLPNQANPFASKRILISSGVTFLGMCVRILMAPFLVHTHWQADDKSKQTNNSRKVPWPSQFHDRSLVILSMGLRDTNYNTTSRNFMGKLYIRESTEFLRLMFLQWFSMTQQQLKQKTQDISLAFGCTVTELLQSACMWN